VKLLLLLPQHSAGPSELPLLLLLLPLLPEAS
jgi:hypothetical protein